MGSRPVFLITPEMSFRGGKGSKEMLYLVLTVLIGAPPMLLAGC